MAELRFRLFGKFAVERAGAPCDGLKARKVRELLCYLLLHGPHPHPREALAALLWPEVTTAQSRLYLRKALWQLQGGLDGPAQAPDALLVDDEWVQLNAQAGLWIDTLALEQAYIGVEGTPGEALTPAQAAVVRGAVAAYRGDLLDGWYHDWCLLERERLRSLYLALLDKLIAYSEAHGALDEGLRLGLHALRYDGAREETHRRLMRLYALRGDRTAALRQYERCATALRDELCVEPTALTRALRDEIRDGRFAARPAAADGSAAALREALGQLQLIERALGAAQSQLQLNIDQLGAALAVSAE